MGEAPAREFSARPSRRLRSIVSPVHAVYGVSVCHAGFGPTQENIANVREFFTAVDTSLVSVGWEPRGDWNENLDLVGDLCRDLGLIHVVDIFRRHPRSSGATCYLRLHGRNRRETDYRYDHADDELDEPAERLRELEDSYRHVYCTFNNSMFNNDNKFENARDLQDRL